MLFSRRSAAQDQVGQPPSAPVTAPAPPAAAPAAAKIHAFNRYEIKYLVPSENIPRLREELYRRLEVDAHSDKGGYGVWSTYYDTQGLRFYWEKIEGLKFRRKLRVRHYGDRFSVTDDSIVHVEIKQRVSRVTQKRRIALPYRQALALCDRHEMIEHHASQRAFVDEVLELASLLQLRPTMMTGYQREAFVGHGADEGVRVTMDHRIRGRDRDFHFAADAENRLIVPARFSVIEFKADERVPYWLTDLAANLDMPVIRVSKYCQGIEAYGLAPRSAFHVPDPEPTGLVPATSNS